MDCPGAHEWYEMERGAVDRDQADRLRDHAARCESCRQAAAELRDLAASLERLADASRADLSEKAAQSLDRRARVHGLIGRPFKAPVAARFLGKRAVRVGWMAVAAVAAVVLVGIAIHFAGPAVPQPAGALDRLIARAQMVRTAPDLARLGPAVQDAVSEELALASPAVDRAADLLLVGYIVNRAQEDRQVTDVRFLLDGVRQGRRATSPASACLQPPWAALASTVPVAGAEEEAGPLGRARSYVARGEYEKALASLPADERAPVLRAWCLERLGQTAEAARTLAHAEGGSDGAMARALYAHLALESENVAEAVRQYEVMAREDDRYWFAAGYLYRYELGDTREAGLRFSRVRAPRLAAYVAGEFQAELAAARSEPLRLVAENFDDYDSGAPPDWALVRASGGEFRIVAVPGGKALELNQVGFAGAELLTGSQFWGNYTLGFDVQVLDHEGDYVVGAAAYRRSDRTGYVLELSAHRLRLVKQFASAAGAPGSPRARPERLVTAPLKAAVHLAESPEAGRWYAMKIRVQRLDDGVAVAGKVWPRGGAEPLGWQVVWTDAGQAGGPLDGGLAGIQVSGAHVLIDNLVIARNQCTETPVPAAAGQPSGGTEP